MPPTPVPPSTPLPRPNLDDAVHAALNGHQGTIGVVVSRLDDSASVAVNADQRFRTASLYKLFVLATAEAAIDSGSLDAQEVLTVTPSQVAADPYSDLTSGTRISIDCALQTMIEMSGNSASDLLEERLGLAAINNQIRALGLRQSSLSADSAVTTPRDVAQLLGAIARGEAVSQQASRRMVELLGGQEQNDRLPQALPLNVRVAHKTGELPGLRHDAGIIFAPSGPYVVAALVQDAPDETAARTTIVDVSRAAYSALETASPTLYLGLPPRLARDVFRTVDQRGRMPLLADPRTETIKLSADDLALTDDVPGVRLRPEALRDLVALQQAAAAAGASFWLRSGFLRPTEAESPQAVPTSWLEPCAFEQPERVADMRVKDEPPTGLQHWLGTVVTISDAASAPPSTDEATSPATRWLVQHGAEFGFVPSLPEQGRSAPREPWTWRWVGRDMAARLQPAIGAPDYAERALAELRRAETELPADPPRWGASTECWTVATTTGRGCASRWYFLPLPGF